MAITTIYLIRHAHADWARDDSRSLSAAGLEAAQVVARRLSALPITALYSSPFLRSVQTVTPLSDCLGLRPELVPDLRERQLPVVPAREFQRLVHESWRSPETAMDGAESNLVAQARALAVVRRVVALHRGRHVVIATHGNLLALILNGLDSAFGFEFWRQLSFPDIYQLQFEGDALAGVGRLWDPAV